MKDCTIELKKRKSTKIEGVQRDLVKRASTKRKERECEKYS